MAFFHVHSLSSLAFSIEPNSCFFQLSYPDTSPSSSVYTKRFSPCAPTLKTNAVYTQQTSRFLPVASKTAHSSVMGDLFTFLCSSSLQQIQETLPPLAQKIDVVSKREVPYCISLHFSPFHVQATDSTIHVQEVLDITGDSSIDAKRFSSRYPPYRNAMT